MNFKHSVSYLFIMTPQNVASKKVKWPGVFAQNFLKGLLPTKNIFTSNSRPLKKFQAGCITNSPFLLKIASENQVQTISVESSKIKQNSEHVSARKNVESTLLTKLIPHLMHSYVWKIFLQSAPSGSMMQKDNVAL